MTNATEYNEKISKRHQRWDDRAAEKINQDQATDRAREKDYGSNHLPPWFRPSLVTGATKKGFGFRTLFADR
ncbi:MULTISPECIES: hypothetical protein [unclassified Mycobacterium]|uniref:hypothetical protein n=1 Tax=unclassified Mycobacterium TaxID=2642494 RepID=UPI000ADD8CCB|nr:MULTISPECIES: hypothetical protein [unclassified Mycobacterium]